MRGGGRSRRSRSEPAPVVESPSPRSPRARRRRSPVRGRGRRGTPRSSSARRSRSRAPSRRPRARLRRPRFPRGHARSASPAAPRRLPARRARPTMFPRRAGDTRRRRAASRFLSPAGASMRTRPDRSRADARRRPPRFHRNRGRSRARALRGDTSLRWQRAATAAGRDSRRRARGTRRASVAHAGSRARDGRRAGSHRGFREVSRDSCAELKSPHFRNKVASVPGTDVMGGRRFGTRPGPCAAS